MIEAETSKELAKLKQAARQEKYHTKKLSTHTRVQIWVPNQHAEAFKVSLRRLQKKYS